jgi:hypothetical protein
MHIIISIVDTYSITQVLCCVALVSIDGKRVIEAVVGGSITCTSPVSITTAAAITLRASASSSPPRIGLGRTSSLVTRAVTIASSSRAARAIVLGESRRTAWLDFVVSVRTRGVIAVFVVGNAIVAARGDTRRVGVLVKLFFDRLCG